MRLRKNLWFSYFILFSIFLLWNYWQPFTADDYGYIYVHGITSGKLFTFLHERYYNWSGRFIADALVVGFLDQGLLNYLLPLINIISALSLLVALNIIYKLIYKNNLNVRDFLLCSTWYILFMLLVKTFAQDFLWKTVAIQYGWGFGLLGVIIYKFYTDYFLPDDFKHKQFGYLLYFILGILFGGYNEVFIAFCASFYLTAVIVSIIFKAPLRKIFKMQYIIFFIGLTISGVISLLAPGNLVRRNISLASTHIDLNSITLIKKIVMAYGQFFRYGYHIGLAVVILGIAIWIYKNKTVLNRSDIIYLVFLIILLNISILSFLDVAYFSPVAGRMLIFTDTILFCIIYKFILIYKTQQLSRGYRYLIYGFLSSIYIIISLAYYDIHQFVLLREKYIDMHYSKDISSIKLPLYSSNFIYKYITYFDVMRTSDESFISLYSQSKIN